MNDIKLATALGWFSLALGSLELLASRRIAHALGLGSPALVQAFGAREVAAGVGVLAYPDNPNPVWARAAGDALDLAVLATALGSSNRKRHNAAWAAVAVVGAGILDVLCASALAHRHQKALSTARRTRLTRT